MVMNVDAAAFDALVQFHLEPEIFSVGLLTEFQQFIQSQALHNFPIHLKLNTGMNRLGFDMDQIQFVCDVLKQQSDLKVQTIFSHLSASGQPNFASFTNEQLANFNQAAESIEQALGYPVVKHIANTGAIAMEKKFHLSMVRLGIGLYGIGAGKLETVVQFHTTIAQIRKVAAAETVGYNRSGKLSRDSIIATVRLGYADGYSRQLGRSKGSMWVQGKLAPVVGDVCMDMTMIDITDIAGVQEGDDVEVFGSNLPIEQVANWAETIPYEILTSIGQRVKRVYIQD
jgi:alanine racemase